MLHLSSKKYTYSLLRARNTVVVVVDTISQLQSVEHVLFCRLYSKAASVIKAVQNFIVQYMAYCSGIF